MSEGEQLPVDLVEDGVLWLINKVAFHPRGFALAYDEATKEFFLWGDGTETWYYDTTGLDDEKFSKVESLFDKARANGGHA